MKIRTIYLSVILFVLVPLSVCAQKINVHEELAKKYLSLMEQNSFEEAAKLFHYPSSYSPEKKKSEFNSVKNALKKYKDGFGSILQVVSTMPPQAEFIGTGISGAEIDYWEINQKQSTQLVFPCKFQNLEFCVIRILFCNIQDKIEIQSVDYSVIKSKNSISILKGILKNKI